jgi:hypothetical protein
MLQTDLIIEFSSGELELILVELVNNCARTPHYQGGIILKVMKNMILLKKSSYGGELST